MPQTGLSLADYVICIIFASRAWAAHDGRSSITIKFERTMDKYRCTVCDWIYDPAVGDPEGGIAAGTAFEDIPEDWVCPLCGVGKDQFEKVEE